MINKTKNFRRELLKKRANLIQDIRAFFIERGLLEVETPLLCSHTVTDPFIESIKATNIKETQYLQTSPEFAMKQLLAMGSGSIFQICKAFREGEKGRLHNPEFTMLEWYRVGFDHHQLMDEMDEFLQAVISSNVAVRKSYHELFTYHLDIDPHKATLEQLKNCANSFELNIQGLNYEDNDTWLMLLMSEVIEPKLGFESPVFVYDYPASQSTLSIVRDNLAERFEVYINGIELANGFHELRDADEQRARFEKNRAIRNKLGLRDIAIDESFLSAIPHMPKCAGVAVGVDRLVMVALGLDGILVGC